MPELSQKFVTSIEYCSDVRPKQLRSPDVLVVVDPPLVVVVGGPLGVVVVGGEVVVVDPLEENFKLIMVFAKPGW